MRTASRPPGPRLSVVIVSHDQREALAATLPPLRDQLREGDELIVVDNASADGTVAMVRDLAPAAVVIETGGNLGFGAACNRGAERAGGDLVCFLNPDARPARGFRAAIERPWSEERGWRAWQALVTAEEGRAVNTRGGVLHFTGIAWAGGAGEPVAADADGEALREREPGFVSGACLVLPLAEFRAAGGFAPEFFLYHEDVDLSLRVRLAGGALGVEPAARVDHDYEFEKGPAKWRYLERNRWATLLRTYPPGLLAVITPALLVTELALLPLALAGGWLRQKLLAWGDVVRWMPRLLRERRAVQARRRVSSATFARALSADLDSAYLGAAGRSRLLRAGLRAYWSLALVLLGGRRR